MRTRVVRLPMWLGGLLCLALLSVAALAQQPTGTIAGVVTDPSGAVVLGANVTIVNKASQFTVRVTSSSVGRYDVPALLPGDYEVRVEAHGFKTAVILLKVEVGRVASVITRLEVGDVEETVTVEANQVRVNPRQTALEGIVTDELIRDLPLNGRNFLDLGQLEPGVQVVPDDIITRGGFARLSVAGQTGLTTRVTVDGLEIIDEHGGGVALNLAADSIQEFQVSRAMPDVSTGLTGAGAVNIATRSGGNEMHGRAFLLWRDDTLAARIAPEHTPFDREQAGFSVGGPVVRDHLFWFVNYERNNQDASVVTNLPPFPQFSGTWPSPSDERMALGRLDWNATRSLRAFFRFTHNWYTGIPGRSFGGVKLAPIELTSNANQTAAGLDATTGRFTHSFRFGYTNADRFSDLAGDIPGVPLTVDPAGRPLAVLQPGAGGALGGTAILIGTHPVSSDVHYQDAHEFRYDGAYSRGRHNLRWGASVNLIRIYWFSSLIQRGPQVNLRINQASTNACGSDILCYPVANANFGNGLGCYTEVPSLGQPCGGATNNRVHWYVGDGWQVHPRLTFNWGLRWVYEPGSNDPDLQKPPLLDDFRPGLSQPNRSDLNNFAPQVGLAWSPSVSGKWVVRAGAGLFYDLNRLQNVMFGERGSLVPLGVTGELGGGLLRDPLTNRVIFDIRGGNWLPPQGPALITPGVNWVGQPLGTPGLLDAVFAAQEAYQSAYQMAMANFPAGPSTCELARGCRVIAPGYETPYALHFILGMQRQLRPGLVLSVDYVRTRGPHFLMQHDANRTGAADTLNINNALAAMNAVHLPRGCAPGAAGVDCAMSAGATLSTYASAGLSSAGTASASGPNTSAFPGMNPEFNGVLLLTSDGSSTYNALQVHLRGSLPSLGDWLKNPSVVASYALGRLEGTAEDQAIINTADKVNNNNPQEFRGPTSLDRTHILSVAGLFTVPGGVQFSSIWKAFSALPQTILVPQAAGAGMEIFFTDFNGDGNGQDVLPGTNRGSYGRNIGCGANALNRVIDHYNSTQAGQLTPAGQALVNAGLFTRDQLVRLGAVSPIVARAPAGQVCLDSLITTDLRVSRPFSFKEGRITIEPGIEWFNLFNIANYDLPDNKLSGSLNTLVGSLNGTTATNRPNRAGGTGSFVLGAPRSWQLILRVTF